MNDLTVATKQHLMQAVDAFQRELSVLRTSRATPALVEDLRAEYYGTMTPLKQLASITAPEPMLLVVHVWDAASLQAVERAIRSSDLGLNPAVEGQVIRVPLPPLTEERRQELVKILWQKSEAARVRIRAAREEAMKRVRNAETGKTMSEDAAEGMRKEVQRSVDEANTQVATLTEQKEQEILRL